MTSRVATALSMWDPMEGMLFGARGLAARCEGLVLARPQQLSAQLQLTGATGADDLASVELLVTGWGSVEISEAVLDRMPRLRGIVHAAGSVKHHLTRDAWQRGIQVTGCADWNAIPVAEYALATTLLAGKRALWVDEGGFQYDSYMYDDQIGNNRRTLGVVGASRIGRRLIALISAFDFDVVVYDPTLTAIEVAELGARKVTLAELAEIADVVSLHAPSLPETQAMIDGEFLAAMKPGAVLINTARADLIDMPALLQALRDRDLHAVLDVLPPDEADITRALRSLPNVFSTPHIAGAGGNEIRRLGDGALEQIRSFLEVGEFSRPIELAELEKSA